MSRARASILPVAVVVLAVAFAQEGCTPKRVDLGYPQRASQVDSANEEDAGGPTDGSVPALEAASGLDASMPNESHMDLALQFSVLGIQEVVHAESCGGPCVPVELHITGGTPPYVIRWDDGVETPNRHVCSDFGDPRSVAVSDAAGALSSLGLGAMWLEPSFFCVDDGAVVCERVPPRVDPCSDEQTLSLDLGRTLLGTSIGGQLTVPWSQGEAAFEVWLSPDACGAPDGSTSAWLSDPGDSSGQGVIDVSGVHDYGDGRHLVIVSSSTPSLVPFSPPPPSGPVPRAVNSMVICEYGVAVE